MQTLRTIKILIAASIVAGVSAIATNRAVAETQPMTFTGITGTAPDDYLVWGVNGKTLVQVGKNAANVQIALTGNSSDSTGNVELCDSCDNPKTSLTPKQFAAKTTVTILNGRIGDRTIQLSNLTMADWLTVPGTTGLNTSYGAQTLAKQWFDAALKAYGLSAIGSDIKALLYSSFIKSIGLQRLSDPNIAYVNQDDQTGVITIGLASYYDSKATLTYLLGSDVAVLPSQIPVQASEVVKVTYQGKTQYLYSFKATKTGYTSPDTATGNYEVTLKYF